ncbi:MAG: response regulator [Nitrospinae bacterium]|nr:response regulator [Nitrospinota bacterium]
MTVRILVADDSITIQKIVAMAFENEDAEVEGIGDGQEAFDKIPDFKPDIVLADVDMPGLDGFQLSQRIKGAPDLSNIKVLLLASDFEDFDEGRFKKCLAENHISKPFKSDDIVQMVTRVMEGDSVMAKDSVLSESVAEKEPDLKEEPSLEELLESVEKLSSESMEMDDVIEDTDAPMQDNEEIAEEEPVVSDEDILGQMIQEVESEISPDPAPETVADDDILGQMIQEVESEISPDPAPETVADDDILGQMIQEVESEISPDPAPETVADDDDVLGQMMQDVESQNEENISQPISEVEESAQEEQDFDDDFEVYAEVQTRKMENLDDLDSAFKEIVAGESKQSVPSEMNEPEMSNLGGIIPEPEDLLERMAPGAFSDSGRRSSHDIQENINSITDPSSFRSLNYQDSRLQESDFENNDDRFIQVTGEQVRHILEKSLDTSLQKEVSGMSEIIVKTIREVVREIVPDIARSVIREEIDKIKKI